MQRAKAIDTINSINAYQALGTFWYFDFFETIENFGYVESYLKDIIMEFEQLYSRFLKHSILSKLNQGRKLLNPPADLVEMLKTAQKWYDHSSGKFNIMMEKELVNRGYDQLYSFISRETTVQIGNPAKDILLKEGIIELIGVNNIDLGGIGKGFLIDKLAVILQQKFGLKYFVINGGGDIYATSNNGQAIEIFLQSPNDPDIIWKSVQISNQSLCSSSPTLRKWTTYEGKEYTHIIDPTNPFSRISNQSYVIAKTAVEADIVATVLCLGGLSPEFFEVLRDYEIRYDIIEIKD